MTFLRNIWYVAGHAEDIDKEPVGRTFLNEPVVMYRTESGKAVALDDRCPHRFAPLHKGAVKGESIQCPYHGLQFDSAGQCSHMPLGDKPPPRACVRSYPLVERYGFLFIWMGDMEKADPGLIPNVSAITDSKTDWFRFTLYAEANYQLLVDNLLDLTHAEFLHPLLSSDGWTERNKASISKNGNSITVNNVAENDNILPIMKALKPDLDDLGTTKQIETWYAPSLIRLDVEYYTENNDIKFPSGHFLTPETESTTHYFIVGGNTVDPSNKEITAMIQEGTKNAFGNEDIPIIQAQQKLIGDQDLLEMRPAILRMDQGGIGARRHLAKLIREEQEASIAKNDE